MFQETSESLQGGTQAFFFIMGYKSLGVWLAAHSPQSSFSNLSQSLDIPTSSS